MTASPVRSDPPVVHAVVFYSPTCPHCYQVITEDLPPLFEHYGPALVILGIDTSTEEGYALYQAAIERFDIPIERQGVPTLIVGDHILVGSVEIPAELPGLIEGYLAQGGVDWPDIPGLAAIIPTPAPTQTAGPEATPSTAPGLVTQVTDNPTDLAAVDGKPGLVPLDRLAAAVGGRLARDPQGSALSITVLIGMIIAVVRSLGRCRRFPSEWTSASATWPVLVLSLVGLVAAGYLAYVEAIQATAFCGPIGDCNAVQQSAYAKLFGIVPLAALGLAGFALIAGLWILRRFQRGQTAVLLDQAIFALALFGTLFSTYLTFLEPFVIGATCLWCIASAVAMAAVLWLATPAAPESRRGRRRPAAGSPPTAA
jgi:uncharacterized membrane protein